MKYTLIVPVYVDLTAHHVLDIKELIREVISLSMFFTPRLQSNCLGDLRAVMQHMRGES